MHRHVPWRIPWLALLILVAISAPIAGQPATVGGHVTYVGEIPKSKIADDAGRLRDLLEVNPKTRGLQFVVAYLTAADSNNSAVVSHAGTRPAEKRELLIDQRGHSFVPPLIAVRAGEEVTFSNSDPANHNVRAASPHPRNEFNVFTGVEDKYQHRFHVDPKNRPVHLSCDIHPWMHAWIYVFDHPLYAVTDREGKFRISAVPAGEFQLVLVQPGAGYRREQKILVTAGQTLEMRIEINRDQLKAP